MTDGSEFDVQAAEAEADGLEKGDILDGTRVGLVHSIAAFIAFLTAQYYPCVLKLNNGETEHYFDHQTAGRMASGIGSEERLIWTSWNTITDFKMWMISCKQNN